MKYLFSFFFTICVTPSVLAQCAPGIPGAGNPNCIPPDVPGSPGGQYRPQNTPQEAIWESRWGAIAIDPQTGAAGTVTGYRTKSEAQAAALQDCGSHGSKTCKVNLAYHDQCAAIAWGSSSHGTGSGPYEPDAKREAMLGCKDSSTDCKIVYSACSYSEQAR